MFRYLLTIDDGLSMKAVQSSGELTSAAAALIPLSLQTVFTISDFSSLRSSLSESKEQLAMI